MGDGTGWGKGGSFWKLLFEVENILWLEILFPMRRNGGEYVRTEVEREKMKEV